MNPPHHTHNQAHKGTHNPPDITVCGQHIVYGSDFSPNLWLHPRFGLGRGVQ